MVGTKKQSQRKARGTFSCAGDVPRFVSNTSEMVVRNPAPNSSPVASPTGNFRVVEVLAAR
jgi:hypothetical protein